MIKASIVIPTKNGGERFKSVINAALLQNCPWEFELLVMDSGSKDETVQYCLEHSVPVHTIPSHEFGHGKTRNLGVSLTKGEFIAFITQDALPANEMWLANLVHAMEQSKNIAGAFGRHLPYPNLDPFTARDLKILFDGFLSGKHIIEKEDPVRYNEDIGYRQYLHFFSNNNSCIRRNVWERYPFPEVEFAEDQIWAKTIIEAGYSKAYADNAMVYHSHNFSVIEVGRRAFDESSALHKLFGYNLCPDFRHLFIQTLSSIIKDVLYTFSLILEKLKRPAKKVFLKFSLKSLSYFIRIPIYNFARQLGYYLGNKHNQIPEWLQSSVSLDKTLKKS